jgi:hypothetical protein
MKTFKTPFIVAFIAVLSLSFGCSEKKDVPQVMCTEEYRIVSLKINGDTLTDFYTVRELTGETIRYNTNGVKPFMNYYPVLEDSYQYILVNSSERFTFRGFIGEKLVVDEPYLIGADFCHIYKLNGNDEITIKE